MILEETKTKIAWVGLYLGITLFIFGTGNAVCRVEIPDDIQR